MQAHDRGFLGTQPGSPSTRQGTLRQATRDQHRVAFGHVAGDTKIGGTRPGTFTFYEHEAGDKKADDYKHTSGDTRKEGTRPGTNRHATGDTGNESTRPGTAMHTAGGTRSVTQGKKAHSLGLILLNDGICKRHIFICFKS